MELNGKITLELDYQAFTEVVETDSGFDAEIRSAGTVVKLTHPDLEGELHFKCTSGRLMQVQLDALNIAKPKTPIEEIVADGQELVQAMQGLKQMVPELLSALKGKTSSRGQG